MLFYFGWYGVPTLFTIIIRTTNVTNCSEGWKWIGRFWMCCATRVTKLWLAELEYLTELLNQEFKGCCKGRLKSIWGARAMYLATCKHGILKLRESMVQQNQRIGALIFGVWSIFKGYVSWAFSQVMPVELK